MMVHGGATKATAQQPTGRGSSVNVTASVFLSESTVVECREIMGLPVIIVEDGDRLATRATLFLGSSSVVDQRAAAIAQLDQLAAAVLAARMILDAQEPSTQGPDDPDDEPTDEPAAELGSNPLYPGLDVATWSEGANLVDRSVDLVVGGKHGYRIDFDGPSRTWEVYSVRHGEAIATGLTLSGAVREVENLTAQDQADAATIEARWSEAVQAQADSVRHTLAEVGYRCRIEGPHARSACMMYRDDTDLAELVQPEPWGLGDGPVVDPIRQAHPMTENEARAAWGDR